MGKHKRKPTTMSKDRPRSRGGRLLIPTLLSLAVVVGVATWFFFFQKSPQSFAAQYTGGPRLLVDKELIDFGTVRFERMVDARFRLRNVGDQLLHLAVNPQVKAIEGC